MQQNENVEVSKTFSCINVCVYLKPGFYLLILFIYLLLLNGDNLTVDWQVLVWLSQESNMLPRKVRGWKKCLNGRVHNVIIFYRFARHGTINSVIH
jgi:hypothetical protein